MDATGSGCDGIALGWMGLSGVKTVQPRGEHEGAAGLEGLKRFGDRRRIRRKSYETQAFLTKTSIISVQVTKRGIRQR